MNRRQTPTKEAVLRVLSGSGKALSQEAIERRVEVAMDRATIYRILNRFDADGLVHKIVAEDGKQYFAVCRNCAAHQHQDDHYHFRCTRCDTIECLPEPVAFTTPNGYTVTQINCVLTGICKDCAS
ncbi:MAG: transcriptional repressor [Sphingobacteriales bacterium]|nr:MAG: transcriptional repressor [Sphingobacteriales bacterium]